MKLPLSLIAIIVSGNLFAQTIKASNKDKAAGIREEYYVLKSDKKIKEGPYAAYSIVGDELISDGFYKNNLKDSVWVYYHFKNRIAEVGKYEKGEKTGVWNTFGHGGELQVQYDFTNRKLLTYNHPKGDDITRQYCVINEKDTVKTFLSRPPIYLDGVERLSQQLLTGFHYPSAAKENNIQGKVIVGFTVDLNGEVSNFRVKKALGYGCDEEALKAVKLQFTGDWLPGILNGNPVVVEYEVPMTFAL